MSITPKQPGLTDQGVEFTVTVEYVVHDCVISREILSKLSHSEDKGLDFLATFRVFQAKITGVARRMVQAGVGGSPIVLGLQNFV
jgi:hypothetical protein